MSKRALITGAAGFVGGHLARRLVSQGWEVVLSDRNTPGFIACDFGAPRDIDALLETTGSVTHVFTWPPAPLCRNPWRILRALSK